MKKTVSIIMVLVLALFALASCTAQTETYKLSVGAALSEDVEKVSLSGTYAAVVTDKDGKIVECRIDAVELGALSREGVLTATKADKTKFELGDNYGMKGYGAKAEWYEQAKFFEDYVTGKTLAQVEGIKTSDADLTAGCTIDVTDFVKAVVAALKSTKSVSFEAGEEITAGLGINASVSDSKGNANFVEDVAAVAFYDGKVVAAVVDAVDATIAIENGVGKSFNYSGTKLEQGDNYGMAAYSEAGEWYEQAQAYANSAVGKSADELSSLPEKGVVNCTIAAQPMKAAIVRAAGNVR